MRPVEYYRLNGLAGSDIGSAITRVGRRVSISIPDRRLMREAIDELRRIEEELARQLPGRGDSAAVSIPLFRREV